MPRSPKLSRRKILKLAGASAAVAALPFARPAIAQGAPLKVGLLLPYSGTFAALGVAITNAMELYVKQQGGSLAGRKIEFVKLDDESAPPKATELTTKLIQGEKVDVLVGTVHSGVAMAMAKLAREAEIPTLIPNAGANALTRAQCAKNIFRTSFGNSQVGYATGLAMLEAGIKSVVTYTWKYAAGDESVEGFKEAFTKGGGKIIKELGLPFPNVEFQAGITEIASLKPEAVYSFYAGAGALKYIKDFSAAGLKNSIQLWGPGFLTDGVEKAAGADGDGVKTALHYVDSLDNAENKKFREDYNGAFKIFPDVYAVQGWDTTQLLDIGLKAVGGDVAKKDDLYKAMRGASFKSPRGPFKLSASQNPIQNFYLRELKGGENKFIKVAATDVSDSTAGCSIA
ncbi:MAG: ABC transporter substrate-binding protein [Xanthobacteraceae bacterium]|nr:ABC transporter substrate-binding protein [Xanthobacteraceae bacterium]QYK45193.1 MAG: ABC transporter substrate-binding protein [Xanthobacteraceae bacterium]